MALGIEMVVLLSLFTALTGSAMSALIKTVSDRNSAVFSSYIVMLYAILFLTPLIAYLGLSQGIKWNITSLAVAAVAGLSGIGKTLAGIRAYQLIDFSVAQPLGKIAPIFVIVGEVVLLSLDPSLALITGIILTVVGAYITMAEPNNLLAPIKNIHQRGVQLAVFAAFMSAIGALAIKFASAEISDFLITYVWYVSGLAGFALILYFRDNLPNLKRHVSKRFVLTGFLSALSGYLTVYLYSIASVSLVSAVLQSSVIFSVVIGGGIFKEKNTAIRILGSAIIIAGIITLSQL